MPETIATSLAPGTNLRNEPLNIDFLYFSDCPSHERALELLKEVLHEERATADIQVHEVKSDAEAEKLRFPGSPTIRIDGHDIEDNPAQAVGLACRGYRDAQGKISPLPPREQIVRAVRQTTRDPRIDESSGRRES